jgi:hypothetical protein
MFKMNLGRITQAFCILAARERTQMQNRTPVLESILLGSERYEPVCGCHKGPAYSVLAQSRPVGHSGVPVCS